MRVSQFSSFDLNSFDTLHNRYSPISARDVPEVDCFAECSRQSRTTAGDFFFLIKASTGQLVVIMGHISSPGAAGFITLTGLAAGVRLLASRGAEPCKIVTEASRIFWEIAPDNAFAPLFCARIDSVHRRLTFTQAGDQTCLVWRKAGHKQQMLAPNAAMLGLTANGFSRQNELPFEPGDALLAMTEEIGQIVTSQMVEQAMLLRTRDIPSWLMQVTEDETHADRAVIAARLKLPEAESRLERTEQMALACTA